MTFDITRRAEINPDLSAAQRNLTFRAPTALVENERTYTTEAVPFCHIYRDKDGAIDQPSRALPLPATSNAWYDLCEVVARVPYLGSAPHNPTLDTGNHGFNLRFFAEAGLEFRITFLDSTYTYVTDRIYSVPATMSYDATFEVYDIYDELPTSFDKGDLVVFFIQFLHAEDNPVSWWGAFGWWDHIVDIAPSSFQPLTPLLLPEVMHFYNFTQTSSNFTNTAQTTQVAADGNTWRRGIDLSGNGLTIGSGSGGDRRWSPEGVHSTSNNDELRQESGTGSTTFETDIRTFEWWERAPNYLGATQTATGASSTAIGSIRPSTNNGHQIRRRVQSATPDVYQLSYRVGGSAIVAEFPLAAAYTVSEKSHFVVTCSPGTPGEVRWYKNGVLIRLDTPSFSMTNSSSRFSINLLGQTSGSSNRSQRISGAAVYSRVLTADEVERLYLTDWTSITFPIPP